MIDGIDRRPTIIDLARIARDPVSSFSSSGTFEAEREENQSRGREKRKKVEGKKDEKKEERERKREGKDEGEKRR